ncbi:MAG TPA: cytochrome c oxidase assembly protein [Ktedonobacterales bacterium]
MVIASIPLALAWDFEPVYVIPLLALAAAYVTLVGPLRARFWPGETVSRKQLAYFLSGILAIGIGLFSPLNFIAMEYLLTAHMIQHVLFTVVGPPLLLLGTPGWLVEPLFRGERVRRVARWVTHPVAAFGIYNLNMWVWHAPAFLDAVPPHGVFVGVRLLDIALLIAAVMALLFVGPTIARASSRAQERRPLVIVSAVVIIGLLLVSGLTLITGASWTVASQPHNPIHTLMDWMFVAAAIIYWCPIMNPAPQLPRIAPLFGMLYLFMSTQPMMALGAMMVLSSAPLYHLYATAPRIFGGTALGDQQLGGLIMWLIMDIPLLAGITILFFKWMSRQERDTGQLTPEEEVLWAEQQQRYHTGTSAALDEAGASSQ